MLINFVTLSTFNPLANAFISNELLFSLEARMLAHASDGAIGYFAVHVLLNVTNLSTFNLLANAMISNELLLSLGATMLAHASDGAIGLSSVSVERD
jgi:hypothetical protein